MVIMSSILDYDPLVLDAMLSFVLIILFVIFMLFLKKDFVTETSDNGGMFSDIINTCLSYLCVRGARLCLCSFF